MSTTMAYERDDATSPTLLLSVRQGDEAAWQRMVHLYGPLIVRWAQRVGLQESDALDIAQDVLLGVHGSLDRFEHRQASDQGTFRGWLWGITRNKIGDFRRHAFGAAKAGGGTGALQQMLDLPDQSPENSEDIADLHLRALEQLQLSFSTSVWTAFWRVTVEGDEAKHVAEDLNISVWAVYKAKARVMARLREEFGEEFLK